MLHFTMNKRLLRLLSCLLLVSSCYCQYEDDEYQRTFNSEATTLSPAPIAEPQPAANRDITIGPCKWAIGRSCPDSDIKYYIYTRHNLMDRQSLQIDETMEKSNLTSSFFNPRHPTKILIHGYNSDMFLNPLQRMRDEYLAKGDYNIFYVDWSVLSPGPCYISAVHNTRQAGTCAAQLVERLVETGNTDIHIIGFSLGAQVPNFLARTLKSFKLPRITGLDPAMPLFITAGANDKLDPSDADFVDVIHTNAMVQGKLERCGHADFYMNGGISQPGCTGWMNSFACSHQRATAYYLESIRSPKGFWGWSCSGYISYLLGMCPATNYLLEAGDNTRPSTRGMFLIDTNDTSPYALGKWTDLPTLGVKRPHMPPHSLRLPQQNVDPLLQHIDQFGKLSGNFNNLPDDPSHPQNLYEHWTSYSPPIQKEKENFNSVEEQDSSSEFEDLDNRNLQSPVNWWNYRRNLTHGYIDNHIFGMPKVH